MAGQSILTSVKKVLGLPENYEAFDMDIVIHINSAFATLNQLGVGPEDGFSIEDKTATWDQFIGDSKVIENVKSYVWVFVRILFDPPQNSATLEAFKETKREHEFRLMVASEKVTDP